MNAAIAASASVSIVVICTGVLPSGRKIGAVMCVIARLTYFNCVT